MPIVQDQWVGLRSFEKREAHIEAQLKGKRTVLARKLKKAIARQERRIEGMFQESRERENQPRILKKTPKWKRLA